MATPDNTPQEQPESQETRTRAPETAPQTGEDRLRTETARAEQDTQDVDRRLGRLSGPVIGAPGEGALSHSDNTLSSAPSEEQTDRLIHAMGSATPETRGDRPESRPVISGREAIRERARQIREARARAQLEASQPQVAQVEPAEVTPIQQVPSVEPSRPTETVPATPTVVVADGDIQIQDEAGWIGTESPQDQQHRTEQARLNEIARNELAQRERDSR